MFKSNDILRKQTALKVCLLFPNIAGTMNFNSIQQQNACVFFERQEKENACVGVREREMASQLIN